MTALTMPSSHPLSLYEGAGLAARAHLAVRWRTCPFPELSNWVPEAGHVLEIGCGHGLFSAYLALQSLGRSVLGIDIDGPKIRIATAAADRAREQGAQLAFTLCEPGWVPPGPWNAIAIVDVLYLLSERAQLQLLAECARSLAPGGVLVVKEMAADPRWKARWNRIQETLAVGVLGLTRGSSFTFLPGRLLETTMRGQGLQTSTFRLDRGRVHPHYLVAGHRPP